MKWRISVAKSPLELSSWPARVSVPLPRGTRAGAFSVKGPDGKTVAAQSRVLVPWPDGSPRWVQLDFQASSAGEHVVATQESKAVPVMPVRVEREGRVLELSVGRLGVTLDEKSEAGIAVISWKGIALASGSSRFSFTATSWDGKVFGIHEPTGPFVVEAEGPDRVQVSWTAAHTDSAGNRLLDAKMRVELLAGVEGFSLSYQFFHKLPGNDWLTLRSIDARFPFPGAGSGGDAVVTQTAYSEFWLRRFVRTKNEIPIILDRSRFEPYVEDGAKALGDKTGYPWFLMAGKARPVGEAVALENKNVSVVCAMHNFEQQRPKTLTVRPGEIHFGIWPERAGQLSLPQGRSCRQVFHFRYTDSKAETVDNWLTRPERCYVEPALCWLENEDSSYAGDTWELPQAFRPTDKDAAFISSFLSGGAARWTTVAEMFNNGDCPDIGYTTGYPAHARGPEVGSREYTMRSDGGLHQLFHTPQENPPVWTNNEYDAIYCLMLEALRTRNTSFLHKARMAARHQIEVDFVHYSDYWQHNRSTPAHTYNHVTTTASIPSHQWTQGLYYYYAVTGDDDVPEVVRSICEYDLMHINKPELADALQFDRELGWTVLALVFGFELTADTKYIRGAEEVIRRLTGLANRKDGEEYEKKHPSSRRLTIEGLGGGFNVNTIPLAVKSYHQATGEKWAYELLSGWISYGMKNLNNRATGGKLTELFFDPMSYVARIERNKGYLKDSLWHVGMFFKGMPSLGWMNSDAPLTTKQFSRIYRGLFLYLSALSDAGLLGWAVKRTVGEDALEPPPRRKKSSRRRSRK